MAGNFTTTLLAALDEKAQWYDTEELPTLLENYRLLHTCVRNLFDFLVKKSLLTPDPYKLDKKVSDIKAPDSEEFVETDSAMVMGQRLSEYESTLDYLCNYYKFSVDTLTLGRIKKLVDVNNFVLWSALTGNSNRMNTRALANIVAEGRKKSSDNLSISMLNDALSKASQAHTDINNTLRALTDFAREYYKGQVRKKVFSNKNYDVAAAAGGATGETQQIKKAFPAAMGKIPFYNELIDEIVQEDHASDKEARQQKTLAKLAVTQEKAKREENKVDTRAMLMEAVQVLGAMPPLLSQVLNKVQENHDILESEHNTLMEKIKRALRRAFNLEEKPLYYTIILSDPHSGAQKNEQLNYNQFESDIATKVRRYSVLAQKNTAGYAKIKALPEPKLLEFLSAQISDCNRVLTLLSALDGYFKNAAAPKNKGRIRGLKIDLTSLKNVVVKANQHRAEYIAYTEEAEQMRKLGIE